MAKLTKDALENYLEKLRLESRCNLELYVGGKSGTSTVYHLMSGEQDVFSGVASEVFSYLSGYKRAVEDLGYFTGNKISKDYKGNKSMDGVKGNKLLEETKISNFLRKNPSFIVRTQVSTEAGYFSYTYQFNVKGLELDYRTFECIIIAYHKGRNIGKVGGYVFTCNADNEPDLITFFKKLVRCGTRRAVEVNPDLIISRMIDGRTLDLNCEFSIYSWSIGSEIL